jgi:hypothetical protein
MLLLRELSKASANQCQSFESSSGLRHKLSWLASSTQNLWRPVELHGLHGVLFSSFLANHWTACCTNEDVGNSQYGLFCPCGDVFDAGVSQFEIKVLHLLIHTSIFKSIWTIRVASSPQIDLNIARLSFNATHNYQAMDNHEDRPGLRWSRIRRGDDPICYRE